VELQGMVQIGGLKAEKPPKLCGLSGFFPFWEFFADRTVVQSAFLNLLNFTTLNNKVLFFSFL